MMQSSPQQHHEAYLAAAFHGRL